MKAAIWRALEHMEQAIHSSEGPIYTDADRGAVLRCFMELCRGMDAQDVEFKAKVEKAARIEAAAKKAQTPSLWADFDEAPGGYRP